jgi:hypothetical protein
MNYKYFDSLDFDKLLDNFSNVSDDDDYSNGDHSQDQSDSDGMISDNKTVVLDGSERKSKRKSYYIPKVRIFKSDIRRVYSEMFANVWNSMDFRLIYGFMDSYFSRDFQHQGYSVNPRLSQPTTSGRTVVNGINAYATRLFLSMLLTPDTTMKIRNVQLHIGEDETELRVESHFTITATRVFELPEGFNLTTLTCGTNNENTTNNMLQNTPIVHHSFADLVGNKRKYHHTNRSPGSKVTRVDALMQSLEEVTRSMRVVINPVKSISNGSFVMYLDCEGRVSGLHARLEQ